METFAIAATMFLLGLIVGIFVEKFYQGEKEIREMKKKEK